MARSCHKSRPLARFAAKRVDKQENEALSLCARGVFPVKRAPLFPHPHSFPGARLSAVRQTTVLSTPPVPPKASPYRRLLTLLVICVAVVSILFVEPRRSTAFDFFRTTIPGTVFAVDPDLTTRSIDPHSPDGLWTLGRGWGIPPLLFRTNVGGIYERDDFLFPFGCREESLFRSKLRLTPFFESRWSKIPPFDGHSRVLTLYQGRSDMGQDYWGFFPFYGYTYRRYGVDRNLFVLFPLYYESTYDGVRTRRILWPLITYANSPGRFSAKLWPLVGRDVIGRDYDNWFFLWPFFQKIDKYPGTRQAESYYGLPFPLFVQRRTVYDCNIDIIWPIFSYYHHYKTGHHRYSFRPLFKYGTGGGIEEISLLGLYSHKVNHRKGTISGTGHGYVSVGSDDIFTEEKFLLVSTIQKRFRKGCLVFARYRFWPFAEYTWDIAKGSHLKVPDFIGLRNDWWDLNLGRLLRFVDFRDTPITRELSMLFGFSQYTEVKTHPHIEPPPEPGEDDWSELILGAFGKQ